ncbi:PASTA domain-containing protein, partial [Streptomyces alfalfae]|uniref:PASTA domain-containing protein n=1 Tax=Streptomyces alfalfae TaxID=1642299 RepID=UPI0028126AD7
VNATQAPTQAPTTPAPVETTAPEPEQPATVAVPSGLEGGLSGDAQAAVSNAGLVPSVTEQDSDQPAGTVLSVSPGPGSQLAPGSTVTIVVSRGPQQPVQPEPEQPAPAPNPTGQAGQAGQNGQNNQGG